MRTEILVELVSADSFSLSEEVLSRGELHPSIAEELIIQARAVDDRSPLTIRISTPDADRACQDRIRATVHAHFARIAHRHDQQIHDIFRFARISSAVGLLFVVVLLACAQAIPDEANKLMLGVRESLHIFAWVAMWKPAELWLYAHLPERHWRRLALRLSQAQVFIEPAPGKRKAY